MAKRTNDLFRTWAPKLMRDLMAAFPSWGKLDAAACVGNGGHESGGFKLMQEIAPTVKGSKGGLGGFQWTGPRRRKFEAWCLANSLHPQSYEATVGYLIVELKGSEKAAVNRVAKAKGLDDKVEAFELGFERAGVKHYPSRKKWAALALGEFDKTADKPAIAAAGDAVTIDADTGQATDAKASGDSNTSAVVLTPDPITDPHTVSLVQQWLKNLGYHPGEIDGNIGALTKDAIRSFRADYNLPAGDFIDGPLQAAINNAKAKRELEPKRANATPAEVAAKVPEVAAARKTNIGSAITAAASAALIAIEGVASQFGAAVGYVTPVKEFVSGIPWYGWAGLVLAISGGLYLVSRKGVQSGVAAYQEGARL